MAVLTLALSRRQPQPSPPRASTDGPALAAPPADWSHGFEECFQNNYSPVLAYALRRLGDRAVAEDVAAETFLVAWRRIDLLPEDQLPWLLAIARNIMLNERRAGRRRQRLLSRLAAESPTSVDLREGMVPPVSQPASAAALASGEFSDQLHDSLARLSRLDREALMLTSWDGLNHREAAAVLGCSPSTFDVRLHRARKRLARNLDLFDEGPS